MCESAVGGSAWEDVLALELRQLPQTQSLPGPSSSQCSPPLTLHSRHQSPRSHWSEGQCRIQRRFPAPGSEPEHPVHVSSLGVMLACPPVTAQPHSCASERTWVTTILESWEDDTRLALFATPQAGANSWQFRGVLWLPERGKRAPTFPSHACPPRKGATQAKRHDCR